MSLEKCERGSKPQGSKLFQAPSSTPSSRTSHRGLPPFTRPAASLQAPSKLLSWLSPFPHSSLPHWAWQPHHLTQPSLSLQDAFPCHSLDPASQHHTGCRGRLAVTLLWRPENEVCTCVIEGAVQTGVQEWSTQVREKPVLVPVKGVKRKKRPRGDRKPKVHHSVHSRVAVLYTELSHLLVYLVLTASL